MTVCENVITANIEPVSQDVRALLGGRVEMHLWEVATQEGAETGGQRQAPRWEVLQGVWGEGPQVLMVGAELLKDKCHENRQH